MLQHDLIVTLSRSSNLAHTSNIPNSSQIFLYEYHQNIIINSLIFHQKQTLLSLGFNTITRTFYPAEKQQRMRNFSAGVIVMSLRTFLWLASKSKPFTQSFSSYTLKPNQGTFRCQKRIKHGDLSFRYAYTGSSNQDQNEVEDNIKPTRKKINKKLDASDKSKLLAAAFDELARKDGFDSNLSYKAKDETFEDDFLEDDFFDDNDDDDNSNIFDEQNLNLSDFTERKGKDYDFLDDNDDAEFRGGSDDNDDMQARIRQAKRDIVGDHDTSSYRPEYEPRVKNTVTLVTDAMTCSACGSDFQSRNDHKPGYLPTDKFDFQIKLSKVEKMQNLIKKAEESPDWSTEDEVEFLIQTSGKGEYDKNTDERVDINNIDIDAMLSDLGLDISDLDGKKVVCKRCHGLQNFGMVEDSLRPGWTDEPTLSQAQFRELLRPISEKPAVIIAMIDLFDFGGSVLRELDGIAGDNPVILAANKFDLMPSQMGKQRIGSWVRRELEYMGVESIANFGGSVRLVSCKSGDGISSMLDKAKRLANDMDGDIFVVGAANAGKSSLINYILSRNNKSKKNTDKEQPAMKIRPGNRNQLKGELTTSPLPGTTLKFIKIELGDGQIIHDTPGLLVPGTITQLLTPEELKIVCPKKQVEPISFRVASGKCVLVGGLAKIEVIGDSKSFLLTFFVANEIKLHPTDSSRADDFTMQHAGKLLSPPLEPGPERMADIGEFDSHIIEVKGAGWKEAAADITLSGLGWIAVTGAGTAKLKVSVPKGIGISVRPPLMPFDIWEVAAKYTGGKAVRKASKSRTGKRRRGVGRN